MKKDGYCLMWQWGLMMQQKHLNIFVSIGLYHDNGLSVFKNSTWKNKKELTKNIQGLWFRNTESNLRIVNYLDVTLNLNDGSFKPCDKPDIIQYVNKEFNHPPNLIKHLPASIEKGHSNNILSLKKYFKNQLFIMRIH